MKNTRADDGALGEIRSEERGVIKTEACGIISSGEHIKPTGWAGGTQRGRGYGSLKRIWTRTESVW